MNKLIVLGVFVIMLGCGETVDVFQQFATATIPMKLGEGSLSVDSVQWNNVFVSSTNALYFTKNKSDGPVIKRFDLKNEQFIENTSFDFPNNEFSSDIYVNAEESLLLFSSIRAEHAGDTINDWNIWKSVKVDAEWQTPELLFEHPLDGNQFYPWLTDSGNVYFSSTPEGGNSDLYVANFKDGQYSAPVKLPDYINTSALEGDAYVAPDESYLIFAGFERDQNLGKSDLYISYNIDNAWTSPVWLGDAINSDGYDGSPFVTQDGKYLLFTSSRGSTDDQVFFNHYIVPFDEGKYREAS
jgi:hypothetical protein